MNLFVEGLAWLADSSHWTGSGGIWTRVAEHLALSLLIVGVAAALAVPAGVLIGHTGRGRWLVTTLTGAARALPTLGLLTLLALWVGIGLLAPVLALVVLAAPVLLAGAYAGVEGVDRQTVDAARAVGMTEAQIITQVELPLAAPLLLGALRNAMLQVIATATVAAYIADSGLGRLLFIGLKSRDYPQMIAGAVLVIGLALVMDGLLAILQWAARHNSNPTSAPATPGAPGPATARGGHATLNRRSSMNTRALSLAALVGGLVALTACGSADDLGTGGGASDGEDKTIVIGSQDYYSNEILAEIYAQTLEDNGYAVDRQFRIGQREVYVPEIENGSIDLFPEYSGPLLQHWKPDTTARLADDVYAELQQATPDGLRVLAQSAASDQDSYTVTKEFAQKWGVATIADLAKVTTPLTLGGNSEGENRPNGPKGLKAAYGVTVDFTPIEDGGGPLTVKALKDGQVQLAIIYTASPALAGGDLVTLADPKGLFTASQVVPVASQDVDDEAAALINRVSAAMSADELVELNARSVTEQLPAATIAKDWLRSESL